MFTPQFGNRSNRILDAYIRGLLLSPNKIIDIESMVRNILSTNINFYLSDPVHKASELNSRKILGGNLNLARNMFKIIRGITCFNGEIKMKILRLESLIIVSFVCLPLSNFQFTLCPSGTM